MNQAPTSHTAGRDKGALAAGLFRGARVCLLTLLAVVSFEYITAVRETLLLAGAALLAGSLAVGGNFRLRATALFWPLVVYILIAVVSIFTSVDPLYSLSEIRGVLLKGIFAFYVMLHLVGDQRHIRQAWSAMLIGAALMSVSGLALMFFGEGYMAGGAARAGSLADGYQYFATYLVLVWPFILLAPWLYQGRWARLAGLALIPISAAAAYATQTRGAWLALCAQTALLMVVMSRRRLLAAVGGLALIAAMVSAVLWLPQLSHGERWEQLWRSPQHMQGSAGDLLQVWSHAWQEIKQHPFKGIGYGRETFTEAYPAFRQSHQPLLWHTHNVFVENALHLGVQGLAALLLILVMLAINLWPRSPPAPGQAGDLAATAGLATLAGFCVRNLTDSLFVDSPALLFWMIMGLAYSRRYLPAAGGAR